MSTVAQRIKDFREKKGISLSSAAEKLEVSEELLADWEDGKKEPDTATVLRMAKLYGESPEMILYGADGRNAPKTMFPNSAAPAFSPFASWVVLVGALLMFTGLGGILLMIMQAIARGVDTVSAMVGYCGVSLAIFGAIFVFGLVLAAVSAYIRYKKHKNKDNRR